MIRDFSESAKAELLKQIEEVKPDGFWASVGDFFADIPLTFRSIFGDLKIENYDDDVSAYHKEILDCKDTTRKNLDKIFRDVGDVDNKYSGKFELDNKDLQNVIKSVDSLATIMNTKNSASRTNLLNILRKTILIDNETIDRAEVIANNDTDAKNELIKLYEELYPDEAANLDAFLATGDGASFSEDDIRDIKYLIYSAPEPYRTIFLQNISRYSIGTYEGKDSDVSYFDPKENQIIFTGDALNFLKDYVFPYTVFFHESGHAADENSFEGQYYFYTINYLLHDGNSPLAEAINNDVYNSIRDVIEQYTSDPDEIEQILESIKYNGSVSADDLDPALQSIREDVIDQLNEDLSGASNACASDIYGGVTNNTINGGFGHFPDDGEDIEDFTYWYSDGESTNYTLLELFAEYYAAYMVGDEATIGSIKENFPEASEILDQMVQDMAQMPQ